MKYQVCNKDDIARLMQYLFEQKQEIIPSAIDQMYMNEAAVAMRLEHQMEISILAIEEETGEVQGVISTISPNVDENWTIVAFHVKQKYRRQQIATTLLKTLKTEMLKRKKEFKSQITLYQANKIASACMIINGFELEGKLSAVNSEKDMVVWGVICKALGE